MSLDSLYPFAGNHAIQSAVFALEWPEPLLSSHIAKIRSAVEELKSDFPAIQDQQLLMVNLGPGRVQAGKHVQTEELGGFVLSRDSTLLTGPSRTITVNREACLINVADYTRWEKVKADVVKYLNVLLPAIDRQLNIIGLQYQDVFNWRDEPERLPVAEVFKKDSPYLPPNVFTLGNLWHSHHGYFEVFDEPRTCRQLDNINVARAATPAGAHFIQVLTSHRAEFNPPVWEKNASPGSLIDHTFERMHDKNKQILRDLLSEEVQSMVRLNKQEVKHAT